MRHRLFSLLIAGVLFGSFALPTAHGQDANSPAVGATPNTAQGQTIRQRIIDKIEQLKYQRMKTRLDMDDATAEKFFQVYKPAEKDIQSLVLERNAELKALAAATARNASDAEIAGLTSRIKDLNSQIGTREQTLDKDLTPLLTPLQRGKLLVFEHEFNQRVREQLAEKQTARAKLRALRQQVRRQRIKNRILKKQIEKSEKQ